MRDDELEALMMNEGIIRNRLKIFAAQKNAVAVLAIQQEFGSLGAYLWNFVHGVPLQPQRQSVAELPAQSKESDALSRDLKKRGMTFVGSTIMYAFMQAVGMVNDHTIDCFRYQDVCKLGQE